MIKLAIGGLIFIAILSAAVLLYVCCAIAGIADDTERERSGE